MSALGFFSPVPNRAALDRRLKAADHRCLLAVCDLADKDTGYCLASQKVIGKRAAIARQKIGDRLAKLERCSYIARISRGRHSAGPRKGQMKTYLYRVLWDVPDAGAMSPTGVTRVEAKAMSPTGVTEPVSPTGVTETKTTKKKKEGATSIFRARADADRLDRVVDTSLQLELPFPEVRRFQELWQQATKRHGFTKVVKLDLAVRRRHRHDPRRYLQAMTDELEGLSKGAPGDIDTGALKRARCESARPEK